MLARTLLKLPSDLDEAPTDASRFYRQGAWRRLRDVNWRVDPDGLMRANHGITTES